MALPILRPARLWIGAALVAAAWIANWTLPGLRTHLLFFPLWAGYAIAVDGLVFRRTGTSLLARSRWRYLSLFLVSAPAWWLFELINWRTQNWFYDGREYFSNLHYFIHASISFSTVMPAVFGTAELLASLSLVRRLGRWRCVAPTDGTLAVLFSLGWTMLALLLWRPDYFFPFVWLSVFFILEPVNARIGGRTLLDYTVRGDWRPVVSLAAGCLVCGFFWEMWNFHSYPKWIYRVPYVGFCHVFEMPILGYLGYIPFSLELFTLYHLAVRFLRGSESGERYILPVE